MCPSCREPLAVAQSPQAYAERNFIRGLIAQGLTKAQIERQLVAQYGPSVLGKPPAHGFNLTVYVLPPALVLLGLGILAITLPRWRRRTRAASLQRTRRTRAPLPAPPTPSGSTKTSRPSAADRAYIDSGALTPSRPSDSAIVRCVATESATRNDSTSSGSAPTTRQCS